MKNTVILKNVISKIISLLICYPIQLFFSYYVSSARIVKGTDERKLFGCDIISNNSFSRHVIRMLFNEIEHNDDVGDIAVATTLTFLLLFLILNSSQKLYFNCSCFICVWTCVSHSIVLRRGKKIV